MDLRLTLKFEHEGNIYSHNEFSKLWGFPRLTITNPNKLKIQELVENEIKLHSKEISEYIAKDILSKSD